MKEDCKHKRPIGDYCPDCVKETKERSPVEHGVIKPLTTGRNKMFIGLMGVENDGETLVSPKGNNICKVPACLALRIQKIQHWIAEQTWR